MRISGDFLVYLEMDRKW